MRDLGLLAGDTDGDILNVLKSLPGIRTPDGKPGSLNFRGSTFDHTLIYFEVAVPRPKPRRQCGWRRGSGLDPRASG